jgi:L-lactate utilization protein LutB
MTQITKVFILQAFPYTEQNRNLEETEERKKKTTVLFYIYDTLLAECATNLIKHSEHVFIVKDSTNAHEYVYYIYIFHSSRNNNRFFSF